MDETLFPAVNDETNPLIKYKKVSQMSPFEGSLYKQGTYLLGVHISPNLSDIFKKQLRCNSLVSYCSTSGVQSF